jgi:hypothetical protein
MARYAKIDRRIWNDARFRTLSERGKLVFLFLLTHPNSTMLGAMRASVPGLAAELEMSTKAFQEAFGEALSRGIAKHDLGASFIWLPNFLKYNRPESPNVVRSWPDAFDLIPECALKRDLFEQLKAFVEGLSEGFKEAFAEAFPKDYGESVTVTEAVTVTVTEEKPFVESFASDHLPGIPIFKVDPLEELVKEGWQYFLEKTNKSPAQYEFTQDRLSQGRRGFEALVRFAKRGQHPKPREAARELFRVAVDRMASSKFHNGKNDSGQSYLDWHHLFKSKDHRSPTKLLEYWLDDSKWAA